ncbi:MAG: N-acetylglucosamine kinase [Bacteroidales bacterium]|jgi:N-acetylglucosamine kinase-like BadF-type ATPase|nr:N-acetylglucosamine kinase [Bacteroidales bacterium]
MTLIADSGSSKTTWCLTDHSGVVKEFSTKGYNPCYPGSESLSDILKPHLNVDFDPNEVTKVAFYGAGVLDDKYSVIEQAIQPIFPHAKIDAASDLMAAARALLGHDSGFAAILGTGSNSCLYDGTKITHQVKPLGFILGDEGSGAYMGKYLIGAYLRNDMPDDVRKAFKETCRLTDEELITQVYSNPTPNRYCASFANFLTGEMAGHEYMENVVRHSFNAFFHHIVSKYPDYGDYAFNCAGSIGWLFRRTLAEVAKEYGMMTKNIISSPMEGLVVYHQLTVDS